MNLANAMYPEQRSEVLRSPVVTTQPTILMKEKTPLAPMPFKLDCPCCNHQIITNVHYQANAKTHLTATLLCCACFCIAWLPYCMNDCKEPHHFCPKCGSYLGKSDY